MSPEEFRSKIAQKIKQLDKVKLIYPVATKIHDDMTRRVFDKGVGGDNKDFGEYSSTPAYFTKKQFKKTGAFKAQGKKSFRANQQGAGRRRAQLDRGNSYQRTSMYLPYGYKQLKAIQGMQAAFVDLQYSRDLRNDFATKLAVQNNTVIAKVSRKNNQNKIKWLSDKYGPETFKHTKEEKEFFKTEVTKRLIQYLSA